MHPLSKKHDHKQKLSCIRLQMQSPLEKTPITQHQSVTGQRYQLNLCSGSNVVKQHYLSHSAVTTHHLWYTNRYFLGAGKDIKAILIQPVSLSSQDGRVGDCSGTTWCREIAWKKDGQPAPFFNQWYSVIWRIYCIWDHITTISVFYFSLLFTKPLTSVCRQLILIDIFVVILVVKLILLSSDYFDWTPLLLTLLLLSQLKQT